MATVMAALTASSQLTPAAASSSNALQLSEQPIQASSAWKSYVQSPLSTTVKPVAVSSSSGTVVNPQGLVDGGSTTLTYPAGGTAPVLVLDFGKDIGGIPQFTVSSLDVPNTIETAFSETTYNMTPLGDGSATNLPVGNSGAAETAEAIPVAAPGSVSAPQLQGGFRYMRITLASPGTVTLSGTSVSFSPPLETSDSYAGYFLSNSDQLNKIWFDGAYTANLVQVPANTPGDIGTNAAPIAVDGAKRDRAVWSGDLVTMAPTLHAAFGSAGDAYVKGALALLGSHPATAATFLTPAAGDAATPGPMPGACAGSDARGCLTYSASYSINFVQAVYAYWMATGDTDFVRSYWPMVTREIAWEQQQVDPATGLFKIDSTNGYDCNLNDHSGEGTAVNALHYNSLESAAAMAQAVGDASDAQLWQGRAEATKAAVNAQLWNPALGAYDAFTDQRGVVVQDANVWAVDFGIASPDQAAQILQTLNSTLQTKFGMRTADPSASGYSQRVSPYLGGFTLYAQYQSRRPDLALQEMGKDWGWMISHEPNSTMWERIDLPDGTMGVPIPGGSVSAAHGWSTGPTSALTRFVLGIAPRTAGYDTWSVRPQPQGLQWAQGQVAGKNGPIAARWQLGSADSSLQLTVQAPSTGNGTVSVPTLGQARTIYEDGNIVWDGTSARNNSGATANGDYIDFPNVTGNHTWAWTS